MEVLETRREELEQGRLAIQAEITADPVPIRHAMSSSMRG
jgi:hypothetical protein